MTMNQLRYFQVLARMQHYGRAAEALYISQPSLSRAISLLEGELDVALFTKHGRGIVLTQAGGDFLQYVDQALSDIKQGVDSVQRFSKHSRILSFGCITPFLADNPVLDYMRREIFSIDAPRLISNVCQTEGLLTDLKMHRYDLVFCSYSPSETEIKFIPVIEQRFIVAMRPDDPLCAFKEILPSQLKGREIMLNTEPIYSSLIQRIFDYFGLTPSGTCCSNEDMVLLRLLSDRGGIFISTDHLNIYKTDAVLRPLRQNLFHRYIYLAYLPQYIRTSSVKQLIDYAKEHALTEEGLQPCAAHPDQ